MNDVRIPDTVTGLDRGSYVLTDELRAAIKQAAGLADDLRQQLVRTKANGEAIANGTLAYRHLEDASMRLGNVLQALDGGVSVYDRSTTVGVPDATGHDDAPTAGEVEGLHAAQADQPTAPEEKGPTPPGELAPIGG